MLQPRDLHRPRPSSSSWWWPAFGLGGGVALFLLRRSPDHATTVLDASAAAAGLVGVPPGIVAQTDQEPAPDGPLTPEPPPPELSVEAHRGVLREATAWAAEAIPLFECSDPDITTAYYYRWRLFWLHVV